MKLIRNFTSTGIASLVGGTLCILPVINGLIHAIDSVIHGDFEAAGAAALGMVVFAAFSALFFFTANRLMCSVWREDDHICRVGLFGGFYKEVAVKDIQRVVIRQMYRECDFICLVDNSEYEFDRARKDSFICFPHTEEGLAFLQSFWDKDADSYQP